MDDFNARAIEEFEADAIADAARRGLDLDNDDLQELYTRTVQTGTFGPLAMRQSFDRMLAERGVDQFEDPDEDHGGWDDDEEDEDDPVRAVVGEFLEPNAQRAAQSFDRPLSRREEQAVWDATVDSADSGHLDPETIARDSGVKRWDQMTAGEITAAMVERARDLDSEPDDVVIEVDPETGRPTSDRGWNQLMMARMEGRELVDADDFED